jgi:hypothetical protein
LLVQFQHGVRTALDRFTESGLAVAKLEDAGSPKPLLILYLPIFCGLESWVIRVNVRPNATHTPTVLVGLGPI